MYGQPAGAESSLPVDHSATIDRYSIVMGRVFGLRTRIVLMQVSHAQQTLATCLAK